MWSTQWINYYYGLLQRASLCTRRGVMFCSYISEGWLLRNWFQMKPGVIALLWTCLCSSRWTYQEIFITILKAAESQQQSYTGPETGVSDAELKLSVHKSAPDGTTTPEVWNTACIRVKTSKLMFTFVSFNVQQSSADMNDTTCDQQMAPNTGDCTERSNS